MDWPTITAVVVACGVLLATVHAVGELPEPQRHTFNCSADGSRWPYLVQQPADAVCAVLINLHGHYSDHHQGMTEDIYGNHFGRLRRICRERGWVYVCPWYGGNSWMGPVAESGMCDLLAVLREQWPGRPIYLSGGSMGGTSALIFAVRQPDLIAGVVARCPAADIESYYHFAVDSDSATLQNIAAAIRINYTMDGHDLATELSERSALKHAEQLTMPVYLCHGARDKLIPVEATRALAAQLREQGRLVYYLELPEGDHDAPVIQTEDWRQIMNFLEQA